MQYVRSLEQRVKQLEDDKRALTHKINQLAATTGDPSLAVPPESGPGALSGRPEAVVRALQVLEVREQLEREQGRTGQENMSDTASADMDDGEKALVREMCNVSFNSGPNKSKYLELYLTRKLFHGKDDLVNSFEGMIIIFWLKLQHRYFVKYFLLYGT